MEVDIFRQIVLSQIPRILGLGDRDETSPTFGCFDRYYWCYKLHDFPNGWFQNSILILSLIYSYEFKDNIYYKNTKILKWLIGGIKFWHKIQHEDGSFDEIYPFERSFCVTSFTTYTITYTFLLLKEELSCHFKNFNFIEKAAIWLCENKNEEVSNQIAAAALALLLSSRLTQNEKLKKNGLEKLDFLIDKYDKKGYFPEYEGLDIGYLTLTMSILTHINMLINDKKLEEALTGCEKILNDKIDDKGRFDYRKCTRGVQFIYPYGLYVNKSSTINKLIKGLLQKVTINPIWLDDIYFLYLTLDYLQTYLYSIGKYNVANTC